MKALDTATERADSKAKLQSLLDTDFRVRSLTATSCASFVRVIARQPRKKRGRRSRLLDEQRSVKSLSIIAISFFLRG
jgi:hypothetical protein